jgi:hypothetical protein
MNLEEICNVELVSDCGSMVGFGGTGFGSSDSVSEINQLNIVAASVTSLTCVKCKGSCSLSPVYNLNNSCKDMERMIFSV